jgi:cellulose synthase/poly-beta-1,6-N-acetylglucosamine synthase-like glycosyltransferase
MPSPVGMRALGLLLLADAAAADWLNELFHLPPAPPAPPPAPPGELTLQWGLFVILSLLCCLNTLFFPIALRIAIGGWIRGKAEDRLRARPAASEPSGKYPPVCALVPCFLPNEEGIIMGTIQHIIERSTYPGKLVLMVVYNTPKDMPIEADLHALERHSFDNGRSIKVMRVHGSRSKAENLNEALKKVSEPLVAIYDADHHPDPDSLTLLVEKQQEQDVDAVQGSVYIRDLHAHSSLAHTCLARYISAEFFCQFFIFFPMLEIISATGFFGGSNALWRVSVLRDYEFSTSVQTEDIDLSARAILNNRKLAFCPESRSGELTPADFRTLFRQRLRWLIGWDQVTLSCMKALAKKKNFSLRQACGLYFLFQMRWLTMSCTFVAGVLTPYLSLFYVITNWGYWTRFELYYSLSTYWLIVLAAVIRGLQHEPPAGMRHLPAPRMQVLWIVIFYASAPLYVTWTVTLVLIGLVKIFTGRVGAWHVTRRAAAAAASAAGPAQDGQPRDEDAGPDELRSASPSIAALMRPSRDTMSRVPSWLAYNPFGTFRFNQMDEPLEEERKPREPIAEEDGGSLSPNNTPTWKPYLLKKSNDLKDMMLPSSYRSGSREDVRCMTSLH